MDFEFMKVFIILVCYVLVTSAEINNVCSKITDYNYRLNSKNCWYNSDVDLSVPNIILKYGYPLETYQITTQDGYILQLFRIPCAKNAKRHKNGILQPILLQHGIFASAAPWVTNGNNSIGFKLADEGYDTWIANSRGSTYGKGHIKLSENDKRYWNFSYHEMAIYDLPNTLDFIYKITYRKDIIVIGNSLGTNIQLAYASELKKHASDRVKFMVYLAPTVFAQYAKTPYLPLVSSYWPLVYKYYQKIKNGEVLSKEIFSTKLLYSACCLSSVQIKTCEWNLFTLFGYDFINLPPEIFPVILGHYPAGSSLKTVDHIIQTVFSGKFRKYDYGTRLNLKYYHSFEPPEYEISRIKIPGLIIYGLNDFVATKEGALELYEKLPKGNKIFEVNDKKYNHIDFFFAKNVFVEVINPLIQFVNKYKVTLKEDNLVKTVKNKTV